MEISYPCTRVRNEQPNAQKSGHKILEVEYDCVEVEKNCANLFNALNISQEGMSLLLRGIIYRNQKNTM